jgi:two-component system, OmpR family, response regulator QseB
VRLLLVDDNAMNRQVIRHMLDTAGVSTTEAADGGSGLELLDQEAFDLVLMDLRMPGMDGLMAVEKIRARGDALAALPVIVVTADAGLDVRARCLAAGADDVLPKPVQMQALFDAIGKAMAREGGGAALLG